VCSDVGPEKVLAPAFRIKTGRVQLIVARVRFQRPAFTLGHQNLHQRISACAPFFSTKHCRVEE
jgi:hypothetical protein